MSRKQPKRRAGNMVFNAIAGIFILAVICGVGFSVASADSSNNLVRADAFGFGSDSSLRANAAGAAASSEEEPPLAYREQSVLASTSRRTIKAGIKMIEDREERERLQAEAEAAALREFAAKDNVAVFGRIEASKAKQAQVQETQPLTAAQSESDAYGFDLPEVDWSVGMERFVPEWASRIDAYLEGSPLAGYGQVFAEAAWEHGIDPRWSPAISNTESSKGFVCFLPCNAWGWGQSSWGDWESAIRAHVAGLADGYGYCITPQAAAKYCPPNAAHWYASTISQMATI